MPDPSLLEASFQRAAEAINNADARAITQVQVYYVVMSQGYMVVADGKALDAAADLLFKQKYKESLLV